MRAVVYHVYYIRTVAMYVVSVWLCIHVAILCACVYVINWNHLVLSNFGLLHGRTQTNNLFIRKLLSQVIMLCSMSTMYTCYVRICITRFQLLGPTCLLPQIFNSHMILDHYAGIDALAHLSC